MSKHCRTGLLIAVVCMASFNNLQAQQQRFEVTGRLRCAAGFNASVTFMLTLNGAADSDQITIDCVSGGTTPVRVQAFNPNHPPNDSRGRITLTNLANGPTTASNFTLMSLPGFVRARQSPVGAMFRIRVPEAVLDIETQ